MAVVVAVVVVAVVVAMAVGPGGDCHWLCICIFGGLLGKYIILMGKKYYFKI